MFTHPGLSSKLLGQGLPLRTALAPPMPVAAAAADAAAGATWR